MTDLSSKELLYGNQLTYQEKYKIADILKILTYLPPEKESPIMELPQDMINIICGDIGDRVWNFKITSQHFLNMVNKYQSTIREIKLKYNSRVSNIQLFKKYYTCMEKLTVQDKIHTSNFSTRHCVRRPNLQMKEFLTWNNLKILVLENYDSYEYIENNIVCSIDTVIINSNVHKFLKVLLKIALSNIRELHICVRIDENDDNLDDSFKKKKSIDYFNELISKIETLELFSFYIQVKNDGEIKQFLDKIKYPVPKNKNVDYHIKSCKEVKRGRKIEYLVQIDGKFE